MLAIDVLNVDRQTFQVRLDAVDCRMSVWRQPSDGLWYADLEIPTGFPAVRGRCLVVDTGLLNGRISLLTGDIYVRTMPGASGEPGEAPWGHTHRLVYEP